MRLTCPRCGAQYEIDAAAIPPAGREVGCSACGHMWRASPPTDAFDPTARPVLSRPLSDSVIEILREEAARELKARAAERVAVRGTGPSDAARGGGNRPPPAAEEWGGPGHDKAPAPADAFGPDASAAGEGRPAAPLIVPAQAQPLGEGGSAASGGGHAPAQAQAGPQPVTRMDPDGAAADAQRGTAPAGGNRAEALAFPGPAMPGSRAGHAPQQPVPASLRPNPGPAAPRTNSPAHQGPRSLAAGAGPAPHPAHASPPQVPPGQRARRGYDLGFGLAIAAALAAVALYALAPRLADQGAAGAQLMEWRARVDQGRAVLATQAERLLDQGATLIRGPSGD